MNSNTNRNSHLKSPTPDPLSRIKSLWPKTDKPEFFSWIFGEDGWQTISKWLPQGYKIVKGQN